LGLTAEVQAELGSASTVGFMKPVFVLSDAVENLELGKSLYDSH
jgi:hypothetical protein